MSIGNQVVYIGAESPLFQYSPSRNDKIGNSWSQLPTGGCGIAGPSIYAVQLDRLYFSEIVFTWSTNGNYQVSVGLDGALQSGPASSGGVTLSATPGQHTTRLEVGCAECDASQSFTLQGARITTPLSGTNATLDDASAQIAYTGFTSGSSSDSTLALQAGSFYQNTISYTSTAGASASFLFIGSAIYIFGPTGPQFGTFQIKLDNDSIGFYNCSSTLSTFNTLLWFSGGLGGGEHQVEITNQDEGFFLALDYFVANLPDGTVGTGTGATIGLGVGSSIGTAAATAAFPDSGSSATTSSGEHNGGAGAAIGGVMGTLAGLILLWLWWRYRLWRRAGGEGDFFVALCGAWSRNRPAPQPSDNKFKLWPMVSFKPKYDT